METALVTVELGALTFELERPAEPEMLLDERRFTEEDEFLPYWAESWASGEALARHVEGLELTGRRVLELGCGLGLPSLVAAARGADVLATDWAPEAIELLRCNADRNGITLRAETMDWRAVDAFVAEGPFDLVLAADVAYEARNVQPVARLVAALGAEALIADPGRWYAEILLDRLRLFGCPVGSTAVRGLPSGAIHHVAATPP